MIYCQGIKARVVAGYGRASLTSAEPRSWPRLEVVDFGCASEASAAVPVARLGCLGRLYRGRQPL